MSLKETTESASLTCAFAFLRESLPAVFRRADNRAKKKLFHHAVELQHVLVGANLQTVEIVILELFRNTSELLLRSATERLELLESRCDRLQILFVEKFLEVSLRKV